MIIIVLVIMAMIFLCFGMILGGILFDLSETTRMILGASSLTVLVLAKLIDTDENINCLYRLILEKRVALRTTCKVSHNDGCLTCGFCGADVCEDQTHCYKCGYTFIDKINYEDIKDGLSEKATDDDL